MKMFARPYRLFIHYANGIALIGTAMYIVYAQSYFSFRAILVIIALPLLISTVIVLSMQILDRNSAERLFDFYFKISQILVRKKLRFLYYCSRLFIYAILAITGFQLGLPVAVALLMAIVAAYLAIDATYMLYVRSGVGSISEE
jgi:hypothetical protein